MEKMYDVLAIGRACVDEVLEIEAFPAEDSKASFMTRIREGGGQASTAACLIAHLGGNAKFVGILGKDADGQFARRHMHNQIGIIDQELLKP